MPSKIAKIVFAILTVLICIIIVTLAITLSLQNGDKAKSSGKLICLKAPLFFFSINLHPCIAASMKANKTKRC